MPALLLANHAGLRSPPFDPSYFCNAGCLSYVVALDRIRRRCAVGDRGLGFSVESPKLAVTSVSAGSNCEGEATHRRLWRAL
jgi:hypothetical protein